MFLNCSFKRSFCKRKFCTTTESISVVSTTGEARRHRCEREGREFEKDFFGFSPTFNPEEVDLAAKSLTFHEKLSKVAQLQETLSWDPRNPATRLAKNLTEAVKGRLPEKLKGKVLLYCALGTCLDHLAGIDGFFVLENNLLGPVTFNLARSACWHQQRTLKANGLITIADMGLHKRIKYIGRIIGFCLIRASRKENGKSTGKRLW